MRDGVRTVIGDRYKKPDDNKKPLCIDAENFFCWAIYRRLPYDEIEM